MYRGSAAHQKSKCEGGVPLPLDGGPCPTCGARPYERCAKGQARDQDQMVRMRAALERLLDWNEGIRAGRGNHHPQDHIDVIREALTP